MVATRKKTSRRPYRKTRKLQKGGFALSLFKPLVSRVDSIAQKQWALAVERGRLMERARTVAPQLPVKRSDKLILESVRIALEPSSITRVVFGIGARFGLTSPLIEKAFNLPPRENVPITPSIAIAEFIALAKGDKSIRDAVYNEKYAKITLNKYKEQGLKILKNVKNASAQFYTNWQEHHFGNSFTDFNYTVGFNDDQTAFNLTPTNIAIAAGATPQQARELNTKIATTLSHIAMEGLDIAFKAAIVVAFVTGGPVAAFEATGIPHMKQMAMGLFETSRTVVNAAQTEGLLNISLKTLNKLRKTIMIEVAPASKEVKVILATTNLEETAAKMMRTTAEVTKALKSNVQDIGRLQQATIEMESTTRAYEAAQQRFLNEVGDRALLTKVEQEVVQNVSESKKFISDAQQLVNTLKEGQISIKTQLQKPLSATEKVKLEQLLSKGATSLREAEGALVEAQQLYEIKLRSADVSAAKAAASLAKDQYLVATELETISKIRKAAIAGGEEAKALYKAKVLANRQHLRMLQKAANEYTAAKIECESLRSQIFKVCNLSSGGGQVGGAPTCSELMSKLKGAVEKLKTAEDVLTKATRAVKPRAPSTTELTAIEKLVTDAKVKQQADPAGFNLRDYPGIVYLPKVKIPVNEPLTPKQSLYIQRFLEGIQKKKSFSSQENLDWTKLPDAVVRELTNDQLKIYIRSQGDVTPDILRGLTRLLQERAFLLKEPFNGKPTILPRKTDLEYYAMQNANDSERTSMGNYLLRAYGKPTFNKMKKNIPVGGCTPPCELDHKVPIHAFSTALTQFIKGGGAVDEELLRRVSALLHNKSNFEWISKNDNTTFGRELKAGMKTILESTNGKMPPTSKGIQRFINNLESLLKEIDTSFTLVKRGGGINEDLHKLKSILIKFIGCLQTTICDEETKDFIKIYLDSMEMNEEIEEEEEEEGEGKADEQSPLNYESVDGGTRKNKTRKHKHKQYTF